MSPRLNLKELFPPIPTHGEMFMLEAMTYKVILQASPLAGIPSRDLIVEAWTNQCDDNNAEGEWHAVTLPHLSTDTNDDFMIFGTSVIITSDRDFEFTFRAKIRDDADYTWFGTYQKNGRVTLAPPREKDAWTQGPNFTHILNSIHCGNFITTTKAKRHGFTHVLNVASNLDVIYEPGEEVIYKKVGMTDGGHNPIPAELLSQAVSWLQEVDLPSHRVLVNCRAGIGRAGSTVIAFVFAARKNWSFEQCKEFVSEKRYVYPHRGLKDTLYQLYPREQ